MRTTLSSDELAQLCTDVLLRAGVDARTARVLAGATVEAELAGNAAVGVAHLFDYLDGYRAGRIAVDVEPVVYRRAPAVIDVDARGGLAQTAFARVFEEIQEVTREAGVAAAWIKHSFTCGELGYYPRRLAQVGFVALAAANSPALMSVGGSPVPVLGTNPLAYAVPRPGQPPFVIDQASSSTAYVNIRRAAEADEPIPAGWALDSSGQPTQDARDALRGMLLPFGSHRGGNLALLVEILATLSGASFSTDAAPFDSGSASPGVGVFLLSLDPARFAGSADRLATHLASLRSDYQVRLPAMDLDSFPNSVDIDEKHLHRLRAAAHRT